MENRSHAMLAGIFTLVFLIAAAVAAIWISKKNIPLKPFELVASSPVTGLSVQSQVRYQGVPVGRVDSLRFIQDKPGQVRIVIGIDPVTPVTEATWAEIVTAGVTGISNVELRDDGSSKVRLESSAQKLAEIPMRPSFFERLTSQGGGMITSFERILAQVEKLTSNENIASISDSLKKFPALVDGFSGTVKRIDAAALQVNSLAKNAEDTVKELNRPGGAIYHLTQSLQSIQEVVAQMRTSTLPDVTMLSVSVSDAAHALTLTSRQLTQAPQSLIFGPPRAVAGPGEPGFAGFGATAR
jgi:phospholipid/cholesterol/gamma-HCH transport system substrate-binding protein